ncbi:hypothetical protein [Burkholderia cenocepacia]|uniref:hypothetical protein n=1 Tax=Burkholderia cenocepacia TaxID=95486 RepID=UPI0007618127|nr:hypothetical protein [Burkholderia cenocepacia]KWU23420.1 hypothetical protein AS149_37155 [Burkholderia cenocepacia]
MPRKLDPAERESRRQLRSLDLKANIECMWLDQMDRAQALVPTVGPLLAGRKPLTASQVWLLLCLAEVEEYNRHVKQTGNRPRCSYIDDIAPRTRHNDSGWRRGVPGFTSRVCRQLPDFVTHMRNGYAELKDLGLALVLHLRETYPQLQANARPRRETGKLEVPDFVTLDNTEWRRWLEPIRALSLDTPMPLVPLWPFA